MVDIFGEGTCVLYVDGVVTPYIELDTTHGVDNPIGDCSFTIPRPMPARLSLLRDGMARPGSLALATVTGYAVGQGRTVTTASEEFTYLTALSGTFGAGMREYAQLRLRRADDAVQTFRLQLVRLPANGGGEVRRLEHQLVASDVPVLAGRDDRPNRDRHL